MYELKDKAEKTVDVTGIGLTPGNHGKDCKGNGNHYDENGENLECCCDERNYMLLCFPEYIPKGWKKIIERYISKM